MAGLLLAMTGCAQEEIFEPSAAGIPQASDYTIGISVDEFNTVELNILDKGVILVTRRVGCNRPSVPRVCGGDP